MQPAELHARLLDAAGRAFAGGDYRLVVELTDRILAESKDEAVRESALRLRARLGTSPLARAALALTLVLLVGVTWFAYSR